MFTFLVNIAFCLVGYLLSLLKSNPAIHLFGITLFLLFFTTLLSLVIYSIYYTASFENSLCAERRVLLEQFELSKYFPEYRMEVLRTIGKHNYKIYLQQKCYHAGWSVVFSELYESFPISKEEIEKRL